MGMLYAVRPIKEPYSEEALLELNAAWEEEKGRLEEAGVTIPKNVEPLLRRVFFNGYAAAMNVPPF